MNTQFEQIAQQFDLDESTLRGMISGVKLRVESLINQGIVITPEIMLVCIEHWWKSQNDFYNNYLNNTNGTRDKFIRQVYDELKGA